ncbi:MAG: hypothetical protein KDC98_07800 [Planctomycetes bacterium]|nr:hypothetical protein [Planctomycetota bacterium]
MLQSTLTAQFLGSAGHVVIGISQYDNDPLDAGSQELWLDQPYNVERQPDGPGAANKLTQWSGTTNSGGAYTLTLAGASYAAPTTALEPANAWALVLPQSYPGQQLFAPDLPYQHTLTGELVWVDHVATADRGLLLAIAHLQPEQRYLRAAQLRDHHASRHGQLPRGHA